MPYAMMTFSGASRSNHRRSSAAGIIAAPCRIHSMVDRSRDSTPGTAATRCSIVGVAVKVVTPKRSMASSMSTASNFSRMTRRSPPSSEFSVVNPLVWYIGAGTRIICGRLTGSSKLSANGVRQLLGPHPGASVHDDLRSAGRSAAADPVRLRRHPDRERISVSCGGLVAQTRQRSARRSPRRRRSRPARDRVPSPAGPSGPAPARRRLPRRPGRRGRVRPSCAPAARRGHRNARRVPQGRAPTGDACSSTSTSGELLSLALAVHDHDGDRVADPLRRGRSAAAERDLLRGAVRSHALLVRVWRPRQAAAGAAEPADRIRRREGRSAAGRPSGPAPSRKPTASATSLDLDDVHLEGHRVEHVGLDRCRHHHVDVDTVPEDLLTQALRRMR